MWWGKSAFGHFLVALHVRFGACCSGSHVDKNEVLTEVLGSGKEEDKLRPWVMGDSSGACK